jgi:two-component system LytT family response regulator
VTKHRILIVDDEPLARERLRGMLKGEPEADVIGEYGNGTDALAAIRRDRPDIVFLDVQMPGSDGLKVVAALEPMERPAIIFVTAHDKFAVEAFEVRATDYLLKPFSGERLGEALARAAEEIRLRRTAVEPEPTAPGKTPTRLAFKSDGRIVFLKPDEIIRVEAADNYVLLHLTDASRLILRETMSAIEQRLGSDFARINRSAIVRLDQVKELQPTFHGDYNVVLRDATRLPLSRSLRGNLQRFIVDRF